MSEFQTCKSDLNKSKKKDFAMSRIPLYVAFAMCLLIFFTASVRSKLCYVSFEFSAIYRVKVYFRFFLKVDWERERAILANWNSPNLETNSISQPVRWIESLTQEGAVTLKLHWWRPWNYLKTPGGVGGVGCVALLALNFSKISLKWTNRLLFMKLSC